MSIDVKDIGPAELRHIVWKQMDVRPDPSTEVGQLHAFLQYKTNDIPKSSIDEMREELVNFINENRNRLSLPCDGNCYEHTDGVVLACYQNYQEDNNG